MRNQPRLAAFTIVVLGTALLFDAGSELRLDSRRPGAIGEIARIQSHLERVERELRSRDVSVLSAPQRLARAHNISSLRDYRQRGSFPHNHDFSDRRIPYFIDRHGTRCAMAHLIELSGGNELVSRVAATCNNARVGEIAGDTEFLAWLEREGLTVAEAARIQPEYGSRIIADDDHLNLYAAGTVGLCTVNAIAIALNMNSAPDPIDHAHGSGRGTFGVIAGIVGLGLGLPALTKDDDGLRGLGAFNTGIGAISLLVGVTTLTGREEAPARGVTLAVSPLIGPGRGHGAALHLRF